MPAGTPGHGFAEAAADVLAGAAPDLARNRAVRPDHAVALDVAAGLCHDLAVMGAASDDTEALAMLLTRTRSLASHASAIVDGS